MDQDVLNEIKGQISFIKSINVNAFIKQDEVMIDTREPLVNIINAVKNLDIETDDELGVLSEQRIELLRRLINAIYQQLNLLQGYLLSPDRTHNGGQGIRAFFLNKYGENTPELASLQNVINEAIALSNRNKINSLNTSDLLSKLEDERKKALDINDELETVLNAAQEELAKGGVGKHAKIFHEQAVKHQKQSKNWRLASIVTIIINILVIVAIYITITFFLPEEIRLTTGISSLLLISIISYVLVLCVKNYFTEKHNQLVNEHKANCLDSYNTFAESATGDTKAAILLHATQTIFSHQNSGFLSKESIQSPSPIMEIIRNISTTQKS